MSVRGSLHQQVVCVCVCRGLVLEVIETPVCLGALLV